MLKRFFKDERGSAPLGAAFFILAFFMLGALLFNVHTIYSKYYTVHDELNRCAAITLDANLLNPMLRDTITAIGYQNALDVLETNLRTKGWTQESGGWAKFTNSRLHCRLSNMQVNVSGANLHLTATVNVPLPWSIDGTASARFPLELCARILYIS